MADTYANYAELSAVEKIGVDYVINSKNRQGAKSIIFTPHGGSIEAGASELVREVAKGYHNWYDFAGIKSTGNTILHITSTNFDEPTALAMIGASTHAMSIHGYGDSTTAHTEVGGLDEELRNLVIEELTKEGFSASQASASGGIAGLEPENITNRTSRGMGVQLELSTLQRQNFFTNNDFSSSNRANTTDTFKRYARALRRAMNKSNATFPFSQVKGGEQVDYLSNKVDVLQETQSEAMQVIGERLATETDDTGRIKRAIDSGNKRIAFKGGETYTISSYIQLHDDITLYGNGCVIKGGYGFLVSNTKNVSIYDVVFDGDETTNTKMYGVYSNEGNVYNLIVQNCTFKAVSIYLFDNGKDNIKSRYVTIDGNIFTGDYGNKVDSGYDTVSISYCDDIAIQYNKFTGTNMYRSIKLIGKTVPLNNANAPQGSMISNPEDANQRVLIAYNVFHASLKTYTGLNYSKQCIDLYYGNNLVDVIYNDFFISNQTDPAESILESKNHGTNPDTYNNSLKYINVSFNKFKGKFRTAVKIIGLRGTGLNEIENVVKITNNEVECDTNFTDFTSAQFFEVYRNYKVEIENNNCEFKFGTMPSDITNINAVEYGENEYTRIANNRFKPCSNLYLWGLPTVTNLTFNNVTIMKEVVIEGNHIEYYGYRALTYLNVGTSIPEPITILKVLNNNFVNVTDTQPFTNINGKFKHISYINNRATVNSFNKDLGTMSPNPIVNTDNDWSRTASATAPTGQWYAGQIIWSKDPATAGCAGWICTVGGNPATWKKITIS